MGIACNVVPTCTSSPWSTSLSPSLIFPRCPDQSELAPARWRGAIINLYQAVQIIGVVIATAVVYSLSTSTSTAAWQAPIGMQFIAPFLLLVGLAWMPESPRWLVWQGRAEEARAVLEGLHAGGDPTYSAAEEVAELEAVFNMEKSIRAPALLDVFRGTDLRRTIVSV